MVIAERPGAGGHHAIDQWMITHGTGRLQHRPDLVLAGLDGPGTFTIIDVKVFDPAGPTWVARSHTDRVARAAHTVLERERTPRQYFGPTGALDPADPLCGRMRLCTFTLSTFGAFGQPALALLQDVGRRVGGRMPASLSDEASWAAFEFAPYARMRLSLALRRGLAVALRGSACPDAEAAALSGQGAPPADPSRSLDGGLGEPPAEDP
jgi:hypothetical protein